MAKLLKRLNKIKNNPKDVKWDQFVTILEFFGLTVDNPKSGSHYMVYLASNQEETQIPVPVHNNRVKPIYIKKCIELIELVIDEAFDEEE